MRGIVIAGTHSGSGKTTVTLGLMAALGRRGLLVQPFKCGPDFIDPSLHRLVTGRVSRNLDLRMTGEAFVRDCFFRHGREADIAVVEGVMGCFDGSTGSSAALAGFLDLPVVLVVDVRAMAESVAALVKGFETLEPDLRLAGVILNRVGSDRHLALLTEALGRHCRTPVLGHLPREATFAIPGRHLGLHMGEEGPITGETLDRLAATMAEHVDLDRLLGLARLETKDPGGKPGRGEKCFAPTTMPVGCPTATVPVRIGIARDQAFCFYYEDNLELLKAAGAELVPFSPLVDGQLPENLAGLYLGGGYPELHAGALSANGSMRAAIRSWSESGRPLYAECGGFMYLTRGIVDQEGCGHPMAGVYPVRARMRQSLSSLGYRQATLTGPTLLGATGITLRGHEFHYSDIEPMPADVPRLFRLEDGRTEGYLVNRRTLGGYLHLHFGGTPEAAANFVRACGAWPGS